MVSEIERIAVLGAGPGGLAEAAVLSRRGYHVHLFNRSPGRIKKIAEVGGVTIEGDLGEGFVPIQKVTTDIEAALSDRQLVFSFTPANGQRWMAEMAAPFLKAGSVFLYASGSAGSLEAYQAFKQQGVDVMEGILLGETVTLPQSARMIEPAKVLIKFPWQTRMAAFPAKNNQRLYEAIGDIIRFRPSPNVLDTGINNENFMIHPAPMVLNYAEVERTEGLFSLMSEGLTDGALRCMDALDAEKMALSRALGLQPISIDDLYIEFGSSPAIYREKGENFPIKDRIWRRYITEDVPYGTVMFSSLGRLLGVPTPVADSINVLLSVVEEVDFCAEGRTVEKLGLAGLSAEEISYFLQEGVYLSRS
jgi:opine dehydrogenase